jgi:hypothetical protein
MCICPSVLESLMATNPLKIVQFGRNLIVTTQNLTQNEASCLGLHGYNSVIRISVPITLGAIDLRMILLAAG